MVYVVRIVLIALYTVLWGTVATLYSPFDRGGRFTCWVGRQWIGWILATCHIEVECEGRERLDPRQPFVLMTNHQSVFDVAAIVMTLPTTFHFVAKKELAWVPFFGWALKLSGVGIMIDRSNNARAVASLRRAAERIRQGAHVIIFPEGTRSRTGELQPFKSGGFHLALQAQVPIVPATISGTQRITPSDSLRVESGRIKIRYHTPIPTAGLERADRERLKQQVWEAIQAGFDPAFQQPLPAASAPGGDLAVR